jgi:hypothetical protein
VLKAWADGDYIVCCCIVFVHFETWADGRQRYAFYSTSDKLVMTSSLSMDGLWCIHDV